MSQLHLLKYAIGCESLHRCSSPSIRGVLWNLITLSGAQNHISLTTVRSCFEFRHYTEPTPGA
jgi:hypothetical protein